MNERPEHDHRHESSQDGAGARDLDSQIAALTEVVGTLAQNQRRMESQLRATKNSSRDDPTEDDPSAPAPWVWFVQPAASEDENEEDPDPRITIHNFVTWYNATFIGLDGSRARPIPACWQHHPGLAMEVACLAYSWRAANIGPTASVREAQYWLHQWRPGFADRLSREWVHAECFDEQHRDDHARPRQNRFAVADQQHSHPVESNQPSP